MRRDDLPEIKQALKDRIEDLCRKLLPDGRRQGRLWVAHNPVTGDYKQSPEFKVAMTRDIGAWIDWRSGDRGDVIKLVQYLNGCQGTREALDWARDYLGLRHMDAAERQAMKRRADERARENAANEQQRRLKRMAAAERRWSAGFQDGAGSAAEAHARRYFAARGIPLEQLANRDHATFRFDPAHEFWPRAAYEREPSGFWRKTKDGPLWPAVLSAMRQPTGQISAYHATFLDPLGPRKVAVGEKENAKLMYGEAMGAVIRLTHGPEGEPPETARVAHPLILGEGIETVATVAIALPEARAWAGGSLAGMAKAPVWLPCISGVIVLKDHFKSPMTEKQFADVMAELSGHGKPISVIDSTEGNDFNDMVKGE